MHILLTDILTCPRCGPAFGLIVLADEIGERQVVRGQLGCPNCRRSYLIEGGVADLRPDAETRPETRGPPGSDAERAYRMAALLGVTTANANLLIVEPSGSLPAGIAEILPQAHVIGASTDSPPDEGSEGFLSRVLISGKLPFRNHSIRGVALAGSFSPDIAREAARVLMPGARLVVDDAGPEVGDELRALGCQVQLEQERVVVAGAPGPG